MTHIRLNSCDNGVTMAFKGPASQNEFEAALTDPTKNPDRDITLHFVNAWATRMQELLEQNPKALKVARGFVELVEQARIEVDKVYGMSGYQTSKAAVILYHHWQHGKAMLPWGSQRYGWKPN